MIVLAHRGLWRVPADGNSRQALRDAFAAGFGIETDVRDFHGRAVVSHDPPIDPDLTFSDVLDLFVEAGRPGAIAVNVKSDGLQREIADAVAAKSIGPEQYFVFDMAVPDALGYLRRGMPCFTRRSEIEPVPAFIEQARGIWLDCFTSDWIDEAVIFQHCDTGIRVALVSPELHGREFATSWHEWRNTYRKLRDMGRATQLMICTDRPREARTFFDAPD